MSTLTANNRRTTGFVAACHRPAITHTYKDLNLSTFLNGAKPQPAKLTHWYEHLLLSSLHFVRGHLWHQYYSLRSSPSHGPCSYANVGYLKGVAVIVTLPCGVWPQYVECPAKMTSTKNLITPRCILSQIMTCRWFCVGLSLTPFHPTISWPVVARALIFEKCLHSHRFRFRVLSMPYDEYLDKILCYPFWSQRTVPMGPNTKLDK